MLEAHKRLAGFSSHRNAAEGCECLCSGEGADAGAVRRTNNMIYTAIVLYGRVIPWSVCLLARPMGRQLGQAKRLSEQLQGSRRALQLCRLSGCRQVQRLEQLWACPRALQLERLMGCQQAPKSGLLLGCQQAPKSGLLLGCRQVRRLEQLWACLRALQLERLSGCRQAQQSGRSSGCQQELLLERQSDRLMEPVLEARGRHSTRRQWRRC